MFGFNSSKSKWERLASQCDDDYFRQGIRELFIPFKISPKKFAINLNCMEIGNSYSYDYCAASTMTLGEWCMMPQWERPMGFAEWFLAGFPDVAYWLQTAPGHKAMDEFRNLSDNELIDANVRRFKVSFLKKLVYTYLQNSKLPLETAE